MDKATQGIRERAAEWVIRLHEEALAPADTLAFVAWLRASPVHIREYLRAESAWFALDGIDPQKKFDIDALLRDAAADIVPISSQQLPAGEGAAADGAGAAAAIAGSTSRLWRLAAAVLVAVALPVAYFAGTIEKDPMYVTGVGEQRTVVLEDGSVLEMNTHSSVEVRYSKAGRDISMLDGEAFFTVKPDAGRPFRVFSNGVEVKALGTQFNVYRHDDRTDVTVLEGKVQVLRIAAGADPVELSMGNQAVIVGGRQSVTRDDAVLTRSLAWREQKLIFADEPLMKVVAEINRYNARQLVVADSDLAARKISGVFNVHDPEVIVRFLTRSAGVTVEETAGGAWVLAPALQGDSTE